MTGHAPHGAAAQTDSEEGMSGVTIPRYISPVDPVPPTARWRAVHDYPWYEVSEYGHLRRVAVVGKAQPRLIKASISTKGYFIYYLEGHGRQRSASAHRLVAVAFIGPQPSDAHCVAHNDGNRSNCEIANLRWASQKDNLADRHRHGTHPTGSKNPKAKLTEAQVVEILRDRKRGAATATAIRYGVSRHTVYDIWSGRTWSTVERGGWKNV